MVLDLHTKIRILLVEVRLELGKGDSVALLMEAKSLLLLHLQTVVGQMHQQVVVVHVILSTRCPEVPLVKEVNVEVPRVLVDVDEHPNPDVKFPILVQQWLLNVLLDNPLRILWLLVDESNDIPYFGEKLDATALVERCWLQDPLVILTVLLGHILTKTQSFAHVHL